jgi:hypothetical protein
MLNFDNVAAITISEGSVARITNAAGVVLWQKQSTNAYTFIDSLDIPKSTSFDTGAPCTSADYMYVDWAPLAAITYGAVVHAGNTKIMRFYIDGNNGVYGKVDWYNQQIWKPVVVGERHNMHIVGQKVFLDGVQKVNMTAVPAFTADTNLIIGGPNQAIRLWGVKHGTNESTLDRDYVPAIRNADNAAGLYDQITGEFTPYGSATA